MAPSPPTVCNVCHSRRTAQALVAEVPCHVREFQGQVFHVWRCTECGSLHCQESVDLDRYYAHYPFARARLTPPFRVFYRALLGRLRRQGFGPASRLLDYGCGQGLFLRYLAKSGYRRAVGYDPYASPAAWGNPAVLGEGPYDFVLVQDVLEHVADPRQLLADLDGYLAPGGAILVGTPNADGIRLDRPERYLNELHVPYHLHIYPRAVVERWGTALGWHSAAFYDRAYHDTPWPGLNTRAGKVYQSLVDGTLDAALERVDFKRLATSPRFWFWALAGYWFSDRADMTLVFRKPAAAVTARAA